MEGQIQGRFTRVCLLGDIAVGKTSLALRFAVGQFYDRYRPSFHVNHFERRIVTQNTDYNMLVWDTAGTERFKALTSNYVRRAAAAILVFDVTHRPSFDSIVSYWLPSLERWQPGIPALLVGNKTDQVEENRWAVDMRRILTFCAQHSLRFYATSAKTGENVDQCFFDAGSIADVIPYESDEQDAFFDSFQLEGDSPYLVRRQRAAIEQKKKWFNCCSIM